MDSFNVIISPKALSQLNSYIDYLQYTLLNEQAAYNVWQDAMETRFQLAQAAPSLHLCSHPQLKKNKYRMIHNRLSILFIIIHHTHSSTFAPALCEDPERLPESFPVVPFLLHSIRQPMQYPPL